VDRPGVEVRQRMQLTGTNSSIDLITPIYNIHHFGLNFVQAKIILLSSRCRG
ncbi:hypothetical protein FHW20_002321, partial [Ochrobactrum intermedium]|nr:hypothetical protein [Brucella intermedia]